MYFLETRGRGVFLRASPIDVSSTIRDLLLDRMDATVLTSATLTVDGAFDYVKGRLGVGRATELKLDSEFDYARQAILYLPRGIPDPRQPEFAAAAAREIVSILKLTSGRAFVLFTSYANLREVHRLAAAELEYPILVQGTAPRSALLRDFKATPHAVLLATSSFWQGVDVVGEALSCVIIDKLPFASPGDPGDGGARRGHRRAGRIAVWRVPDSARHPDAQTGSRPPAAASSGSRRAGRARPAAEDDGLRPAVPRVAAAGAGDARPRSTSRASSVRRADDDADV